MKGQSLTETLLAMSVALIVLSVSTATVILALQNAELSKRKNQANTYAQQGVEIVRQMRDANWGTFNALTGNYCMATSCNSLTNTAGSCGPMTGSCGKNVDVFTRQITVTKNAAECNIGGSNGNLINTRVISTVSWSDSKCTGGNACRSVSIASCLGNLYGDPNL